MRKRRYGLGGSPSLILCLAAVGAAVFPLDAVGQSRGRLVTETEAARHGLQRAWYSYAQVDPARGRIVQLVLDRDLLLALTDQGIIHAFDANDGSTQWTTQIGNPNFTSLGPAANDQYVAVINGSTIYVMDRATGTLVWQASLGGGPGGGPALSETYVFAPLISGVVKGLALELRDGDRHIWAYPSIGRAVTQPIVTGQSVVWPTDRGYLYVATANNPEMRFRLETQDEIVAKPGYRRPIIFIGSLDGYVYAMDEGSGQQQWKFSTGDPIVVTPAGIEEHVFVCSQAPGMHCLSAEEGTELWQAPHVERFVAASPERVYGMDRWSNLYILDRASGSLLGRINFRGATLPLVNQETDRLYLASPTGLIQCLHEVALAEPIRYEPPPVPENLDQPGEAGAGAPATAEPPPPDAAEPAADDPFATPDDDPFATPDDDPFNP